MADLRKTFICFSLLGLATLAATPAFSQFSVTTEHNDILRTGLNSLETKLTPSTVKPATFGLLFPLPVDGYVYAEPLYMAGLQIVGKGIHNVVFVATEHNSVYAFDADSNTGANATPLWHVNLGPSVPSGDVGSSDIVPEIGITSTPVILNSTSISPTATLYVVAKTKTFDANNNPVYNNSLHALDVSTGDEKFGGPVPIQATVRGTGEGTDGQGNVPFQPLIQHFRPGLLAMPSPGGFGRASGYTIYMACASHGDNGPYHGWVFGFNAATLAQTMVMNTSANATTDPSGWPIAAGGVWQSGGGLASDGSSLYFSTGNGTFNPAIGAYGDAILKCGLSNLQIQDYFAPSDELSLDYGDTDQGSGGVMLLPPGTGSAAHQNLLVQSGKEGSVFLMDTQNLGKYNASQNEVVQELPFAIGGIWGSPAYFNGHIYFGGIYSPLVSIPIANGVLGNPSNFGSVGYQYPGPTPAVSSNGNSNGIVWAIQSDNWASGGPANLQAYNATNLSLLYNSSATNGRDLMGPATKFTVPMVANGKVYAGTGREVDVFGLGKWTATPTISQPSGNYTNSVTVTLSDATPGSRIYYTTDGSTPTTSSKFYSKPVTFTTSLTLTVRAFTPGYGPSSQVQAHYLINAVIGTGTGLPGLYYNGTTNPGTTPVTAKRTDPTINFNWNGNSPIAGVAGTDWSAEWNGQVQAEIDGVYTIATNSDDGVIVTVNGTTIINDFTDHAPTLDQGTITLKHGVKYNIQIKYYQDGGGSLLQLFWSAPGLPMQIIPKTQLY